MPTYRMTPEQIEKFADDHELHVDHYGDLYCECGWGGWPRNFTEHIVKEFIKASGRTSRTSSPGCAHATR